jgi:hypothetical protein
MTGALTPHDVGHLLHGCRIPSRRKADRRRKGGEVRGDDAVQRLVVEDRRDLEARFCEQVALDGIDRLRDRLGRLMAEEADALFDQPVSLAAHQPVAVEEGQRHGARQLHRLFLDRHLTEQIVNALHVLACGFCGLLFQ